MKTLRRREMKSLALSHTSRKRWSRGCDTQVTMIPTHAVPTALSSHWHDCSKCRLNEGMNDILSSSAFPNRVPWSTNPTGCSGEEGVEAKYLWSPPCIRTPLGGCQHPVTQSRHKEIIQSRTCFISPIYLFKKHQLDAPFCQSVWETLF